VSDAAVGEAMRSMPRARFLPEVEVRFAHLDRPLPIGHDQTCSQPRTVAAMLKLLQVVPGQRILDVGCGSGWTTALLAHLVGPTGRVIGVERIPALVAFGSENLAATGQPWAEIRQATPGVLGAPADGPFDRILVSAAADRLPGELVEQLRPGGLLVIPVAGEMLRVRRTDDGSTTVTHHGGYSFVPLIEG
jgi:protein-L-isoaspartate(D-aspartate) O-methyltransferase